MALLRSNKYIDERGYTIIEEFYGKYDHDGNEIVTATVKEEQPPESEEEEVTTEPEPTQLDLIQAAVEKSNDELRQEGAEAVTLELIERGIL